MNCERLSKHVRLCSSLAQAGSQNAAEGVHVFPSLVGVVKQTEGVPLFSPRSELILRIEGGGGEGLFHVTETETQPGRVFSINLWPPTPSIGSLHGWSFVTSPWIEPGR